jgi:hypothetical protein
MNILFDGCAIQIRIILSYLEKIVFLLFINGFISQNIHSNILASNMPIYKVNQAKKYYDLMASIKIIFPRYLKTNLILFFVINTFSSEILKISQNKSIISRIYLIRYFAIFNSI